MFRVYSFLIGYLIGSVQFAFIIGKLFGKIDIREHGSGNAGMTNVTRVMGAKAGIIVFILDVLKGAIAFYLCGLIFKNTNDQIPNILYGIYGGFGAIIGHDFPFYLKFRGGKGTASTLGFMIFVNPHIALITYILGFLTAFFSKYISLASLVMTLVFFILTFIFKLHFEISLVMGLVMILCYYQHRDNIKRLLQGEERKFSFKKSESLK